MIVVNQTAYLGNDPLAAINEFRVVESVVNASSDPDIDVNHVSWTVAGVPATLVYRFMRETKNPFTSASSAFMPSTSPAEQSLADRPATFFEGEFTRENWPDAIAMFMVLRNVVGVTVNAFEGTTQKLFDESFVVQLAPSNSDGWQMLKAWGYIPKSQAAFAPAARERSAFF